MVAVVGTFTDSCCKEKKDKDEPSQVVAVVGTFTDTSVVVAVVGTFTDSCCKEKKDKDKPSLVVAVVGSLGVAQVCHVPADGPALLLPLLPPEFGEWGLAGHLLAIPVLPASP